MGLFDAFYAELTCPNCGCEAMVEAQTKDFENAMLTFSVGETVESLGQAEFRGLATCRWCNAAVDVPVVVREGHFIGFGDATLRAPQPVPLPPPPLKNPVKAGKIADVVRALRERYRGEVYLGWNRGSYSVAIWHQGQWLHTALWGTVEDTLGHLAEAEGEGVVRQRVQRIEEVLIQRAGGDPRKRLHNWGLRAIDRHYLQEVESKLMAVLQSLGVAFADLTVTAQGTLCLTADGTSAESIFYGDVADTLASLLRHWVRAKAGLDRNIMLFRDDTRAVLKTLERLEMALGMR